MAYIEKINKKSTLVYMITKYMSCGDVYKNGKHHLFYDNTKENIDLLKFIIKSIYNEKVEIKDVDAYCFEFKNKIAYHQKIIFRLCRYVRHDVTLNILKTIKLLIQNDILPFNALLIAHYIVLNQNNRTFYNTRMDIISGGFNDYIDCKYGFKTFEEFFNRHKKTTYNNRCFIGESNLTIGELKKLAKDKMYKKIENILTEYE